MDDSTFLIALVVGAFVFGFIGAVLLGTSPGVGFLLGFFLGPIGLIIAAIMRPAPTPVVVTNGPPVEPTKKCPDCAETILAAARKCRFCGADVSAVVAAPVVSSSSAPIFPSRSPQDPGRIICPKCWKQYHAGNSKCVHCGEPRPGSVLDPRSSDARTGPDRITCAACGANYPAGYSACVHCGAKRP